MTAKIISFINMKGGVGKTTLTVNVGYTLAKEFSKKVLIVDMDPQMNATQYVLRDPDKLENILGNPNKTIYSILKNREFVMPNVLSSQKEVNTEGESPLLKIQDNFYLLPSHLQVMAIDLGQWPSRLKRYLNSIREQFDVILIDSPPTVSAYTKLTLIASDFYIVPIKPDILSLFGLPLLETYIKQIKEEFNLEIEFLGIILNMVRPQLKLYKTVKSRIMENPEWGRKLFSVEIKHTTRIARGVDPEEKTTYMYDMDKDLKENIIELTSEIIRRARL